MYTYCLNNPLKYSDPAGDFLTWSFHKGGFSIGFNLTPIGIPLRAGLNFSWNHGFSIGAYEELGYRIGGTGFGSGITVSQGFDYNFKTHASSVTTSEGAYASIGPFNAGINLSQAYDPSHDSWHNSWNIDIGFGIGFSAGGGRGGMGISLGFGSDGFNFGLGGNYESRDDIFKAKEYARKLGIKESFKYALAMLDDGKDGSEVERRKRPLIHSPYGPDCESPSSLTNLKYQLDDISFSLDHSKIIEKIATSIASINPLCSFAIGIDDLKNKRYFAGSASIILGAWSGREIIKNTITVGSMIRDYFIIETIDHIDK